MTDQELKDIVAAVVAELEKSGVDFDYKADQAKDDDLVFVIRGTAPNYQGVTVTWKGLLDIITAQATQAKNDAVTAKNTANTILTQVQSKGTEITNFVATSKTELETQKNESVNAVKSVYQTDLNELKGDLDNRISKQIVKSEQLLNVNNVRHNGYYDVASNNIRFVTNQYTAEYFAFEIDTNGITHLSFSIDGTESFNLFSIYSYVGIKNNTPSYSGEISLWLGKTDHVTLELNDTYDKIYLNVSNFSVSVQHKLMVVYGVEPKPYEEWYEIVNHYSHNLHSETIDELDNKINNVMSAPKLNLPKQYELVCGDTFELFYRGILNVSDYASYFIEIICDIGKTFTRRYIVTPKVSDIGNHTLTVNIYNSDRFLLATSSTNLIVKNKATNPTNKKVVMYVGDSLAVSGDVPNEFYRRLASNNGNPIGDGLNNITFVGTCGSSVKFEGYGGYSFNSYNTEHKLNSFMWITCNHDKTNADQHSIYKDANGKEWKLETIEVNRIKIICSDISGTLPSSSGTLTWYSGGINHTNITYSASEQASGNPFWNSTANKIDFANYISSIGENTLDYVYVLLGWNSVYTALTNVDTYKSQVLTFISNIHDSYPNCKIVLLGLEIPSRDGLGNNYSSVANDEFYIQMNHVFKLNKLYEDIANENNNVSFVNIAGQFDTENNMLTSTRQVNVRNSKTEVYQINGVHPAQSGYYQIADACYRDFVHKLQE